MYVYYFVALTPGEVDVSLLKPELNDVDGVFQLGPKDRCKDIFVLSVTVAFAGNLASVSGFTQPEATTF